MKNTSFPSYSNEEWKEAVEKTLKGKTADSLSTDTYENITLKPLYTAEDRLNRQSSLPGYVDYLRGINHLGYITNPWKIAQTIRYDNLEQLEVYLNEAFANGQDSIAFEIKEELFLQEEKLEFILRELYKRYPFSIDAGHSQKRLLTSLTSMSEKAEDKKSVSGWVGQDPLAILAETGKLPTSIHEYYKDWSETLKLSNQQFPNLQTILVNTIPYHNSGANAVQELAVAAAAGVSHIQMLLEQGMKLDEILSKMIFKFSVGSQFFMEIAKLRAARIIWSKVTETYGANSEERKMKIAAKTSFFTKTVFDPYVNMLRSGNEAFASVLGGVQYLEVSRFDEAFAEFNSFSNRVARNTQHILREEVHLDKVVDPAGGSWYVESLTKELAEKAWSLFLEIESQGGIVQTLKSGWLQKEIYTVTDKRKAESFHRRKSLIGTNIYANNEESFEINLDAKHSEESATTEEFEKIEPLKQERLSVPFEELRFAAKKITEKQGANPSVGLINLGELKKHKARSDYIAGVLAVGGITATKSEPVFSEGDALSFVRESQLKHYFLCGDNSQYDGNATELVSKVKAAYPDVTLYIAGLPDAQIQQMFKEAGADDFIHIKSNVFHILSILLKEMEVSKFEA